MLKRCDAEYRQNMRDCRCNLEWRGAAGEESYVALDKGPISGRHVLVLPIEHFPSTLCLSPSAFAEVERYLAALRSCFAAQARACRLASLAMLLGWSPYSRDTVAIQGALQHLSIALVDSATDLACNSLPPINVTTTEVSARKESLHARRARCCLRLSGT